MVLGVYMSWMRRLLWVGLPAFTAFVAYAEEPAMTAAQIKQVVRSESITIPMPGEFFAAIDKQGRPNWTQLIRTTAPSTTTNRAQMALTLGTLVADGFVAVEAQDSQAVKNIGKDIINLAKKLNVSQTVLGRGSSINDFAENNDWNALREELEATQNEVKLSMAEQKDQSLIILVTLGAWIRGTEIVSGLVEATYTPQTARVLRQPAIADYLLSQIAQLPATMQADPLIVQLRSGLEQSIVVVKEPTPTDQNIRDLHKIMSTMASEIAQGGKES